MAAAYELTNNDAGKYSFTLKAANGEVILRSEVYESKSAAEGGIASVRTNCGDDSKFEKKEATDGRYYFNLKAANHEVIGTSQMYKSAGGRDEGINSVKTNGGTTTVKEA